MIASIANLWRGALATCSFELRRSMSAQRISVSAGLALFPPVMLSLLIAGAKFSDRDGGVLMIESSQFLAVFLTALVLLLGLLLWATPNVYSELEGKSWLFIASRPSGRSSIFLGKFMASVLLSLIICFIAISLCVLVIHHHGATTKPIRLWLAMNFVYLLATLIYASVFSLIGVLFVKRAMVVGAGFLIGFDVFLASLPGALINRFTARHHLQEIGIATMGWFFPSPAGSESEYRFIYGDEWPTWIHVAIILAATLTLLVMGTKVISSREYVTSDQR
ncbi:ABC transporter permease [Mariniblastus sp.]|nr:ABC transporter permease [Mariniblastus sp.]